MSPLQHPPLQSVNDFVVKFANVNGSGSASLPRPHSPWKKASAFGERVAIPMSRTLIRRCRATFSRWEKGKQGLVA